jgi:hypothetical protein
MGSNLDPTTLVFLRGVGFVFVVGFLLFIASVIALPMACLMWESACSAKSKADR